MPHNMLAVFLYQPSLALPNRLERCLKLGDSFEVFGKQGHYFIVMDRHKLPHRSLDILQKFNFYWAFWHLIKGALISNSRMFVNSLVAGESHSLLSIHAFTPMQSDMHLQCLPRSQKGKAGGFRRPIGLLKVFRLARFQSPDNVGIYFCVSA